MLLQMDQLILISMQCATQKKKSWEEKLDEIIENNFFMVNKILITEWESRKKNRNELNA